MNDALRRYDDVERRIEDISAKSGYGSDLIYDNAVPVYARNAEQLEMIYYSYLSYMADCDVGGLVASGLSCETMCGIVGYAGNVSATCGKPPQVCLQGLQRLEYRGYDSAGVALVASGMGHAVVHKKAGRLANLVESVERNPMPPATAAIGHTRWATNGAPSDVNAHPHPLRTLVVAISQSGETMDTLMALRHVREQGSMVLSICNTQVASIPRESDAVRSSTRSRACRPRSNGCLTRRQARPDSAGR